MNIASEWVKQTGNTNWTGQINTYTRTAVWQHHIVLSEKNMDSTNELFRFVYYDIPHFIARAERVFTEMSAVTSGTNSQLAWRQNPKTDQF